MWRESPLEPPPPDPSDQPPAPAPAVGRAAAGSAGGTGTPGGRPGRADAAACRAAYGARAAGRAHAAATEPAPAPRAQPEPQAEPAAPGLSFGSDRPAAEPTPAPATEAPAAADGAPEEEPSAAPLSFGGRERPPRPAQSQDFPSLSTVPERPTDLPTEGERETISPRTGGKSGGRRGRDRRCAGGCRRPQPMPRRRRWPDVPDAPPAPVLAAAAPRARPRRISFRARIREPDVAPPQDVGRTEMGTVRVPGRLLQPALGGDRTAGIAGVLAGPRRPGPCAWSGRASAGSSGDATSPGAAENIARERANAVANALIAAGLPPGRVRIVGRTGRHRRRHRRCGQPDGRDFPRKLREARGRTGPAGGAPPAPTATLAGLPRAPPQPGQQRRRTISQVIEQEFHRIKRLPPYVFAEVNAMEGGRPGCRPGHHRLRHGQSRSADAAAHRRQAGGGGPEPADPPLFELARHSRPASGPRRLLCAPLRRRDRFRSGRRW